MAKGQEFDFSKYDKRHLRNIARMAGEIEGFFSELNQKAVNAVINFGVKADNDDFDFFFGDFPAVNKIVGDALNEFREEFSSLIERGNEQAWLLSNEKNAELVKSLQKRAGWSDEMVANLQKPNVDALQAFQERKVNGMNLSQRVWNLTQQHKESLELAIECGLADGTNPQKLSRVVRKYLNEPNKLFRRVRDKKTGQLRLSKAAAAYHPGRGVYRSSYKNAIRMSGTETNMAYRTADFDKWKKIDFVIGVEVRLSPTNHTLNGVPFFDVCDQLAGTYPKDFKFVGWHPNCRCFAIPKLPSREEMRRRRMAVIDGGEKYEFRQVTEMPENFTSWIATNTDRIMRAKNPPYFIKDNFVGGDIAKGYRWLDAAEKREWREIGEESKTLTTLEKAAIRHAARTEEEIARIRRMAANRQAVIASGDSYNLAFIRSHAPEFGVSTEALERAYINGNLTTKAGLAGFKEKLDKALDIWGDREMYWSENIFDINGLKNMVSKMSGARANALYKEMETALGDSLKRTFKDEADLKAIIARYEAKVNELAKHRKDVQKAWDERRKAREAATPRKLTELETKNAKFTTPSKNKKEAIERFKSLFPDINIEFDSFKNEQAPIIDDIRESLVYHASRFPKIMDNINFMGSIKDQYERIVAGRLKDLRALLGSRYTDEQLLRVVKREYGVKTRSPRANARTYAYSDSYYSEYKANGIAWNGSRSYKDTIEGVKRDVGIKWHPVGCERPRSIIDHELGHKMDELLGLSNDLQFLDMYRDICKNGNQFVIDNLSEYAVKGKVPIAEFIAEAWSEFLCNPNPRDIAKRVGNYILDLYARKYPLK